MASMAIDVTGISIVVSEVVLIDDFIGDAVKIHISTEVQVVGVDAGVDDHRAEALAAECREAWVCKKLI